MASVRNERAGAFALYAFAAGFAPPVISVLTLCLMIARKADMEERAIARTGHSESVPIARGAGAEAVRAMLTAGEARSQIGVPSGKPLTANSLWERAARLLASLDGFSEVEVPLAFKLEQEADRARLFRHQKTGAQVALTLHRRGASSVILVSTFNAEHEFIQSWCCLIDEADGEPGAGHFVETVLSRGYGAMPPLSKR